MSLPKDAKKVGDVYCHCTKCSHWGQPQSPPIRLPLTPPLPLTHVPPRPTSPSLSVVGMASAATMAEYHYTDDGKVPVTITAGQSLIKDWTEKGVVVRSFCSTCGTHLFCDIPPMKVWTTGPGLWDDKLSFKPVMHAHYEKHLIGMKDGLPKFKDLPTAFGGSGEMITE